MSHLLVKGASGTTAGEESDCRGLFSRAALYIIIADHIHRRMTVTLSAKADGAVVAVKQAMP